MVFQKPNPFPKSIFDNVAYGPKIHGLTQSSDELEELVEQSLRRAGYLLRLKTELTSLEHPYLVVNNKDYVSQEQ